MPIPKSWSRPKRLAALHKPHVSRPDVDNLIKFVNDSLNDVLWIDDAIIYEMVMRKFYSDRPRTLITIDPTGGKRLDPLINEIG